MVFRNSILGLVIVVVLFIPLMHYNVFCVVGNSVICELEMGIEDHDGLIC